MTVSRTSKPRPRKKTTTSKHKTVTSRKNSRKRARKPGTKRKTRNKGGVKQFFIRTLLKITAWCFFISVLAFAGWVLWLDKKVQARFESPFESIPAHLYARPYSFSLAESKSVGGIRAALLGQGYREVSDIKRPGEFAMAAQTIDVYRPLTPDSPVPRAVRVQIEDGRVQALTDHGNGRAIERFVLEPTLIGNLTAGEMQDRILLRLHEVPALLLDALITMEDRRFETHHGVDPLGILRAMVQNLRDGRVTQGGSTLTQQLVKNLYLDNKRTLSRKLNEAMMALIIEWRYSKSEILERYVNTIFLGQAGNRAIHGFGLAAQFYFDRPLADLHPSQLAMLVGMIPAPSKFNPFRNKDRAIGRRNLVLKSLFDRGVISAGEFELYTQTPLNLVQSKYQGAGSYPAYTDLLNRQLHERFERSYLKAGGVKVYSSLDEQIQKTAQKQFKAALKELESKHSIASGSLQGAMMILNPESGEVLALIGGREGRSGDFNRALDARRPIGSLIKPAVYLTALLNPDRYSTMSFIDDAPLSIDLPTGAWLPGNYDKTFHGELSLRDALIHSYNVPAVKVGMDVGLDAVATTLQRLGVETEVPRYPSMLLGASNLSLLEVAQMYQTLANGGKLKPLTTLRTVANIDDDVLTRYQSEGEQMVNTRADFLVMDLLMSVVDEGTAKALTWLLPGFDLAGKTGTTNDYRDSWFVGISGNYLAVVWVGKDDNTSTGLTGSSGALRVWAKVMSEMNMQSLVLQPPAGITAIEVDLSNGERAVAGCTQESAQRYFISGYEPVSNQVCSPVVDKLGDWLDQWFGAGSKQQNFNPGKNRSTGAGSNQNTER